jgi:hypothetical protein
VNPLDPLKNFNNQQRFNSIAYSKAIIKNKTMHSISLASFGKARMRLLSITIGTFQILYSRYF